MMKTLFNVLRETRTVLVAATLSAAAMVYMLVPPPPPAKAFEAQSTWGGTGGLTASNPNAQTIAINNVQTLNDVLGVPLRYIPAADNTGPATIAINGLTATTVQRPSSIGLVALSTGELRAGVTMTIMYNGSTIEILGPVDMTPIGGVCEFRGTSAPRGCLVEDGTCYTKTGIYAPLFAVIGTQYNAGAPSACSGTQFAVPYSNGSVFAANDNQGANTASRITSAGSSCAATASGVFCGGQSTTLITANLPPYTPAGALNWGGLAYLQAGAGGTVQGTVAGAAYIVPAPSFVGSPQGGISQAFPRLMPLLTGVRAIKY